jgi:hypothetical protein
VAARNAAQGKLSVRARSGYIAAGEAQAAGREAAK